MSYAAQVREELQGRGRVTLGLYPHPTTIASANDLNLNYEASWFTISGTTTINGIKKNDARKGTVICLDFSGALTLANAASPGAGYSAIYTGTGADLTTTANSTLMLVYDGTAWHIPDINTGGSALTGVTAGTVTASKAVVVDANKDIGDFRNLDAVNIDAGASGTAGTVDVFPTTASTGKLAISATDNAGNTTTTVTNDSQAGARTYAIPDAGASADFDMLVGAYSGVGAATSKYQVIFKKTGIADNSATSVATFTIPNGNHAAAARVTLLASNGGADAFESSRVAAGTLVFARTTGVNAVGTAVALTGAGIATVAAGATHTLAYGLASVVGAVGATNTIDLQVTIDDSGNLGSNQVVVFIELFNAEASGVTVAAA